MQESILIELLISSLKTSIILGKTNIYTFLSFSLTEESESKEIFMMNLAQNSLSPSLVNRKDT